MAQALRVLYEGAVYHITSRGNARERTFFTRSDRETFREILAAVVERYGWICHAYCLMTNHDPPLIETADANPSHGMRHLNVVYTQRVNRQVKGDGVVSLVLNRRSQGLGVQSSDSTLVRIAP
ncbi:transposase [Candidatus Bipolaricaulota bacterium]|nr:transposase [Candidatus Bipolaricaulota bacterium]